MTVSKKESLDSSPIPKVIKCASCSTLSGTSELSYYIGKDEKDGILFFISDNSGGGYFNKEWVAYKDVKAVLSGRQISSVPLRQLFKGKSLNTSGFLLAVLLAERLVTRSPGKRSHYQLCDEEPFLSNINSLIAQGVDLTNQVMQENTTSTSATPVKPDAAKKSPPTKKA